MIIKKTLVETQDCVENFGDAILAERNRARAPVRSGTGNRNVVGSNPTFTSLPNIKFLEPQK